MFRVWGRRAAWGAGLAAALGLMLASAGAGPALAKPKAGAKAPTPAAKPKPKRDDRDDDLEGVPRHLLNADDRGWLLVEDDYLKVGPSLRIRIAALIAPSDNLPRGVVMEAAVEIDCKSLRSRTVNRTTYSTDLSGRSFNGKMEDWVPLDRGSPLMPAAEAFCAGRALDRGRVPIAPLDQLYAMAFDAPVQRYLVEVDAGSALFVNVRPTPDGQRPQATLTTILKEPVDGAFFMSLTAEFNCERRTYRVHRIITRGEDASVLATSGAEAAWDTVGDGPLKIAAAAACEGEYPQDAKAAEGALGEWRMGLLASRWR